MGAGKFPSSNQNICVFNPKYLGPTNNLSNDFDGRDFPKHFNEAILFLTQYENMLVRVTLYVDESMEWVFVFYHYRWCAGNLWLN